MLDWTAGDSFVDELVYGKFYAFTIKGFESVMMYMELESVEHRNNGVTLLVGWLGGAQITVKETLIQHIHEITYQEFSQL